MAVKSQGTTIAIETTRAATKAITAITSAVPPVVSSSTHGFTAGQIVYLAGVVGMTQLNGRVFVVANPAAGTFELKGVDATTYSAYVSGGTAALLTMTAIGQVKDIAMPGGAADDIEVSHLLSVTKEFLVGLADEGDATFTLWEDPSDTAQAALRTAQAAQSVKGFTVTGSDAKVACFPGIVKQYGFTIGGNGAREANCTVKVSAGKAYFA